MDLSRLSREHRALLDSLRDAIVEIEEEKGRGVAEKIISEGIDPRYAFKYSIAEGALKVGERFDEGEIFLPHLVMAGDLMDEVGKILEKNIPADQAEKKKVIVIATVQGDMHSVGKNIVATMLRSGGFEIHDLGVDVPSMTIIQRAKETRADIIALSSLLTTTMPYQREVIEDLHAMGIRDQFRVMIGGGPVTQAYSEEVGADAYGRDAIEALEVAKEVLA